METLTPGRDVGKYRVVRRLAVGGMAEIYLAQSRGIEGFAKYVVLKRILPQYANSDTFVKLFLNEARVTASLDHPNIASVYDIGAVDGVYFFAMEYLHGEDLGHILREMVSRRERIPLEHALTIGVGVAAGLHAAHEKKGTDGKGLGIVHRDVSPSNVVVTFDGGVKLVDFGVAKLTAQADLTRTGTLKGKVSYMSPEQCNNDPIDRRSDLFALGVLLYELTTQTRLFRGDSEAATLKMVLDARIPPPSSRVSEYPPELEAIVMRSLARDREERFANARDLQVALESVARSRGLVTSTAAMGEWMTRTFGPKLEPWISAPVDRSAEADGTNEQTNLIRPPTLDRGPALADLPDPNGSVTTPRSTPGGNLRRRSSLLAMLGVVVVAASTLTGVLVYRFTGAPQPVVAQQSQPAPGPDIVHSTPPPAPATAPVAVRPPAPAEAPPRRSAGRRLRPAQAPEQFSQAFARKEPELLRCFASFPEAAAQATQVFVRFQVAMNGAVTAADVLPTELAGTALGRCLSQVARSAQFGPQASPVAVRIPVSVRRVGGSRGR
jgi:serine/threonine protein kinase